MLAVVGDGARDESAPLRLWRAAAGADSDQEGEVRPPVPRVDQHHPLVGPAKLAPHPAPAARRWVVCPTHQCISCLAWMDSSARMKFDSTTSSPSSLRATSMLEMSRRIGEAGSWLDRCPVWGRFTSGSRGARLSWMGEMCLAGLAWGAVGEGAAEAAPSGPSGVATAERAAG